jgi:glycosyltransferase involved in cell wall biosynthesis
LLFAGRLLREKGLMPLLEAMARLEQLGVGVELDILGEGSFEQPCREAVQRLGLRHVTFIGTVPYGPEFFSLLGRYQALVVPSLSDEQPRIIYDAYSQGVPVLGTRTKGLMQCVQDGQTGCLTDPGDVAQLVERVQWVDTHRADWAQMAARSLAVARSMTHEQMHRHKWAILQGMLAAQ